MLMLTLLGNSKINIFRSSTTVKNTLCNYTAIISSLKCLEFSTFAFLPVDVSARLRT